jgi:negative regulator of sigma E activity
MTEQINDQISAFIDDELGVDEAALLVRRFERDPLARARALRYTLIGSALRGELLEPNHGVLRRRVAAALQGTPADAASLVRQSVAAPARWGARLVRPVLGLGIAAAVATVAIGTLRMLSEATPRAVPTAAVETAPIAALQAASGTPPPSYVVPQEVSDAPTVPPPIRLTNYLMHHSVYASGLSRTSVSSNVVGTASKPLLTPEVVETEAVEESGQ